MKIVGIILAVLSFIGGQGYLLCCLQKLDQYLEESAVLNDKRDSDSEDSVIK